MSARQRHSQPALLPEALTGDRVGSRRALAEALGISERHAGRLVAEGVLPPASRGGWDAAECRALLEARALDRRDDGTRLLEERTRLAKEQADELAMKNRAMRADLVSAPAARAALVGAEKHIERRLRAIPRRAAPMLLGLDTLAAMQSALTNQSVA